MHKNERGIVHLLVVILIFAVIAITAVFLFPSVQSKLKQVATTISEEKGEDIFKIEQVSYLRDLSFDSEKLTDITKEDEEEAVSSEFDQMEVVIPPKSRVRTFLETFCMDERFAPPHADQPMLLSYEKIDMPLFFELNSYFNSHPEVNKGLAQRIIWELSEQIKFDGFYPEEQEILLKVSSNAEKIIDSYEFNRNITKRAFDFGEEIPKEVNAQPIPGTKLFAKVLEVIPYDGITIEIYNPTNEPQNFSKITKEGIFTAIPAGWVRPVDWENLTFYIAAGQIDISDGYLKTPSDTGAILVTGDSGGRLKGKLILLYPNVELSPDVLDDALENSEQLKSSSNSSRGSIVYAAEEEPEEPEKPYECGLAGQSGSEYCAMVCKVRKCDAEPVKNFSDKVLDLWRKASAALKGETGQRVQVKY